MLVNIMVFILVLVEACFEPLSYNFFSKQHSIVNKKTEISISPHVSDAQTTFTTRKKLALGFTALKVQT